MIADAAALGSEIRELVRFREISNNKIDFFLPAGYQTDANIESIINAMKK